MHYVDFVFPFWSWSRFVHLSPHPVGIYDPAALYAFRSRLDHAVTLQLPFAYPPSFLLVIWPLALVPQVPAYLIWLGASFLAFVWASWQRPWGRQIAVLGLVMPATLGVVYAAQNTFLTAALMIGGCRLVERRPIVAGVLFGLLSFKPQFGVLIPIALVSARLWRPAITAAITVLFTVVASSAAFGWPMWMALPHALTSLSRFVVEHPAECPAYLTATINANLRLLGAGRAVAEAGQVASALVACIVVGLCWRRGPTRMAVAALMVSTFFAMPYAFYYDLLLTSYAVVLVVIDFHESDASIGTGEAFIMLSTLCLPLIMVLSPVHLPYSGIILALLLALIVRRALRARRPSQRQENGRGVVTAEVGWAR